MSTFAAGFAAIGTALTDRLFPRPVDSVEDLGRFVGGRSAYVAQTALFGYLKTRMGTKFPGFFEDPEFSALIRAAAVQVFASCASDLTIHAAASVAASGRLDEVDAAGLARRCHAEAIAAGQSGADPDEFAAAFEARVARTRWDTAVRGMEVFAGSCADVVRVAPVTEDYKMLDRTIVENSTRFRWIGVRDQFARRLDAPAVAGDWRAHWRR